MYMLITFLKVTAQTEEKETKMFSPGMVAYKYANCLIE